MTLNPKWLLLALPLLFVACSSDDDDPYTGPSQREDKVANVNANPASRKEYLRLEFPRIKDDGNNLVVVHTTADYGVNYSVEWDCDKKSQRWSCYQMYAGNSVAHTSRYYSDTNQYPADPDIPSVLYFTSDPFWGSGFDHGHICPSADRLCSAEANYQTFFLSNMQPQFNKFNAGLWAKMEGQVRTWNRVPFRDTLYVCKGGTIDRADQLLMTTAKGLLVPRYFFMAILCKNSQGYKALAFWVEHENRSDNANNNLYPYTISIDQLEELTGIDFFCNLPDDKEKEVESAVFPQAWGLKP